METIESLETENARLNRTIETLKVMLENEEKRADMNYDAFVKAQDNLIEVSKQRDALIERFKPLIF